MARLAFAVTLLAAVLAPSALASDGPALVGVPAHAGSVGQGGAASYAYSTHGDQPCLAIYQPRVFTVTLAYAPPSDVLTLSVGTASATGSGGAATLSFVDNYCTAFTVRVVGTSVASSAEYAFAISSVPAGLGGSLA